MIGHIITVAVLCLWFSVAGDCAEQMPLSSLPQLKKWEIPLMPQKYAMRTGRKFKDIDHIYETGRKRSSHWSIAPELNFREMDLEEDSEKIKLDHNYKVFVEDDDLPVTAEKKNRIKLKISGSHQNSSDFESESINKFQRKKTKNGKSGSRQKQKDNAKKSDHFSKTTQFQEKHSKILSKHGGHQENALAKSYKNEAITSEQKYIIPKLRGLPVNYAHQPVQIKAGKEKGTFLDSSEGQGENSFSTADLKSRIELSPPIAFELAPKNLMVQQHSLTQSSDSGASVSKRSTETVNNGNMFKKRTASPFNEAVRNARAAINALQTRRQGTSRPGAHPDLMKLVTIGEGKPPHAELVTTNKHKQIQQKSLQESKNQAMRLLKNSNLQRKDVESNGGNNGALGDQRNSSGNRIHSNVQNKVAANNINNHVRMPSASPTTKARLNQPTHEALLSQRAKIETPQGNKPKDKMKIVPANVARAVAMAMEQLKRDRMWGKVFVHVLPSGKLKVMVQETKKMPDE